MVLPTAYETVSTDGTLVTKRLKVPAGWVVVVQDSTDKTLSTSFVPDPGWQWELS